MTQISRETFSQSIAPVRANFPYRLNECALSKQKRTLAKGPKKRLPKQLQECKEYEVKFLKAPATQFSEESAGLCLGLERHSTSINKRQPTTLT